MHFKGLISNSFWSGAVVVVRAVSGLAVNKVVAVFFGPAGITLLAHFQNLLAMFVAIPNDGVNRGSVRFLAEGGKKQVAGRWFLAGLAGQLFVFVPTVVSLLIWPGFFYQKFLQGMPAWLWVLMFAGGLLLHLFNLYFMSVMLAYRAVRSYAYFTVLQYAVVVLVVLMGAYTEKLNFTLLFMLGSHGIMALATFIWVWRQEFFKLALAQKLSIRALRALGKFALMATGGAIFGRMSDFVVRSMAIETFGTQQTGLWQACVRLSDGYIMATTAFIAMVAYPQLSALSGSSAAAGKYFRRVVALVVPVALVGLTLVWVFRNPLLVLLNDTFFYRAAPYMLFQVIGDFFKILSFFVAIFMWVNQRTYLMLFTEMGSALLWVALVLALTPLFGVKGFVIGHSIRYVCYFLYLCVVFRKNITAR